MPPLTDAQVAQVSTPLSIVDIDGMPPLPDSHCPGPTRRGSRW